MTPWPDDESLLEEYLQQLGYKRIEGYRSWLRQFQRFVSKHSPRRGLNERVFRSWMRSRSKQSPRTFIIRQAEFVNGFLDWLVMRRILMGHPLQNLKEKYECRSIRAITGALISPQPDQ